jgi:hypothetical protein
MMRRRDGGGSSLEGDAWKVGVRLGFWAQDLWGELEVNVECEVVLVCKEGGGEAKGLVRGRWRIPPLWL